MIAIGVFLGILSIISVFLPWEAYIGQDSFWLTRISEFLGIRNNSFDNLLGLDYLPILSTLIFMLCSILAKKHMAFRILAIASSFVCFAIGAYNILHFLIGSTETNYIPGIGLWLFTIVSLFAFIISILMIVKKGLLEKKLLGKLFD